MKGFLETMLSPHRGRKPYCFCCMCTTASVVSALYTNLECPKFMVQYMNSISIPLHGLTKVCIKVYLTYENNLYFQQIAMMRGL